MSGLRGHGLGQESSGSPRPPGNVESKPNDVQGLLLRIFIRFEPNRDPRLVYGDRLLGGMPIFICAWMTLKINRRESLAT
jgi:hypothetical protein